MTTKLHRIAIHEAGHAALAVVQELPLRRAELGDAPIVSLFDDGRSRCDCDKTARFLIGGFVAERRFFGAQVNQKNSAPDFERAWQHLKSVEMWHRRLCEAELLVMKYRLAIRNVAQELLEYSALGPSRIEKIIRKS